MRSIATPLPAMLALLALAGCGSAATKTVSVSGRPGGASTASGTATTRSTRTATTATTPTSPPAPGSSTASPARTAPAPAFTEGSGGSGGGEDVDQAVAVVKAHGYTPSDTSQYRHGQTLRVLVGTRAGSADGYEQQAFFFLDGRYLGTDTSAPSAGIDVVGQSDTEVTLGYRLYRPGDPLCCARGGQADVHFQLDNGRLSALDPIPPAQSSTVASRR